MSDLTVARTIIEQMGGTCRLAAMINARDFLGDNDSLTFKFSGCRKANKCRVTLLPSDTYKMEIGKIDNRTYEWKTIYNEENLYWDMLKPEFERATGLYLSL